MELSVFDRSTNTHGFVVVFNAVGDPAHEIPPMGKGGTRIAPLVTLDEIRMLARTMALKNAAAGLPLGGAKSGLAAAPAWGAPEAGRQHQYGCLRDEV